MILWSTNTLLASVAVLGHTEPVGRRVDTPGDSKVSQCVCFPLILTLPIVKIFQRRRLDILNYLVILHWIWHYGPGWPGMHCPPASASQLARFRTLLTVNCKQFEFSCLYTVSPLEDAWWPCLDHCLHRPCLPSPRTQSYISLSAHRCLWPQSVCHPPWIQVTCLLVLPPT